MRKLLFLLVLPMVCFSQGKLEEISNFIKEKQFEKAEYQLKEYLKSHPDNLNATELLGDAYGHQKKWDQAIVEYKKLVELEPKTANYHYKYGGVLGMKALQNKLKAIGLIGDIKTAFTTAAELDKNHIETRWALVELYMQLPGIFGGSKSKSLHYAQELENLSKVDGYLAKGYVYEYDNEPDLAEKYYKMAIQTGGSLTCFNKLTTLYEKEKQPEKAIKTIEEAQQKHQRNALHYQIGKVAAEYNIELQKGEQCLQTYIKNYSESDGVPKAWAHYRLAQINVHKNNKETALKHIDMALAQLPKIKPFKDQKQKILNL
ncbi:tetratricopeptide repeat protein [Algibacter amylolyticus]|uniref:Tetratricopeptide repeat protein n=1 Tax=Algibacter amylolyticus TaxID=1608400 RepID=A0A5M7BEZ8_9FLAO|nr:tetratricopeptide repeat protein [Algibacter amylolyticus]KAA5828126.1 tetratricopeptide repeat protein [Algibacter amylolyticus]MBB5267374.1 tetratricopeptide (TPR) repeat protein [Algibacter amylolyticus]TSJ82371.1 tetratricopeptide repeat protein [Algibacter amylolyticus]